VEQAGLDLFELGDERVGALDSGVDGVEDGSDAVLFRGRG
jgi:hypothetical protein